MKRSLPSFRFSVSNHSVRCRSKDRNIVPYERAMNWEEKVFLYNLFEEDIAKLEQLLGWDCANWKL